MPKPQCKVPGTGKRVRVKAGEHKLQIAGRLPGTVRSVQVLELFGTEQREQRV
jgi:hypothetical protein